MGQWPLGFPLRALLPSTNIVLRDSCFKKTAFRFTLDYVPIKDKRCIKCVTFLGFNETSDNSNEERYIGFKII